MRSTQPRVGILGGTFDPVHLGHLAVADAACDALDLAQVYFIPSHHPPHRQSEPRASGYHRFAMVALALAGHPRYLASDAELVASDRSYTSVTLRRLRETFDALQLFFITGADAFAEIATWRDYPAILDLANFVVVSRPGHPAAALSAHLPTLRPRMIACAANEGPAEPSQGTRIWLVEATTPDVSSTEVRRRVHAGEPLDGLVPAVVADYIARHHLYR